MLDGIQLQTHLIIYFFFTLRRVIPVVFVKSQISYLIFMTPNNPLKLKLISKYFGTTETQCHHHRRRRRHHVVCVTTSP